MEASRGVDQVVKQDIIKTVRATDVNGLSLEGSGLMVRSARNVVQDVLMG